MAGEEIVIVGGGICGLAAALALHRKGIRSVVLERAESLRAAGFAITIHSNGRRALDQLGIGPKLRSTSRRMDVFHEVFIDKSFERTISIGKEEIRPLKRSNLIETMAKELPPGTTRFGCRVVAITLDPSGSYPMLKLHDGSVIKSKIVIGCDGANSAISRYLGLKPTKVYEICATRGFTNYPTGHGLNNELTRIRKGKIIVGRAPVDDNLVYWFVGENRAARDSDLSQDVELFGQSTVKTIKSMDPEIVEMIKNNDTSLTSILRYRHPWDILFCNFSKGNVVLAGDAMHVMGPFVEQGGSTAIEDAVVLARCISRTMCGVDPTSGEQFMMWEQAAVAFEQYVRNRRRRLFWLALRIHLIGLLGEPSTSTLACFIYSSLLVLLFHNFYGHAQYDCGNL